MKLLMTLTLALMALNTFAGGTAGNGGVSVVCRDGAGKITTAEILDIYEGREVYGRTYYNEPLSMETRIQLAQLKLARHTNFLNKLQDELTLVQANTVFIPNGNELEPTNDAFPLIRKKGCKFEQLANYTSEGEVLISQEIFEELDTTNRAALYLHEAIYAIRRKIGDTDSQKTRRLVSHLMAANGDQNIIDSIVKQSVRVMVGNFINPVRQGWKIIITSDGSDGFKLEELNVSSGKIVETYYFKPYIVDKKVYVSTVRDSHNLFFYVRFTDDKTFVYSYSSDRDFGNDKWTLE